MSNQKRNLKNKKYAVIIVAVVVLAAIIAGAVAIAVNVSNTPERVAKKYAEGVITADADKVIGCLPDFLIEYYVEELGVEKTTKKELIKALEETLTEEDSQACDIISAVKKDKKIAEYTDDLKECRASKNDVEKMTDACVVQVKLLADGSEQQMNIVCIKFENKWYVLEMEQP